VRKRFRVLWLPLLREIAMTLRTAKLALEDGTVYTGVSLGATGEVSGEVVFNTSMTGYQEILTDPSYRGQIVTMTYPEIGNYGVNSQDVESDRIYLSGFVMREYSRRASNYRCEESLHEYLKRHGIVGLAEVDTRALVRRIRIHGAMRGVLSTEDLDDESLVQKAKACPGLVGRDLVREVMPQAVEQWDEPLAPLARQSYPPRAETPTADRFHVVAMNFGMKWNIARWLRQSGCRVTVVPGDLGAEEILQLNPDGVFLSNGPGDPEPVGYAIETIRRLLGRVPIFGICLGHQLLSLACGARTFKLKFGHRGANQPVLNHRTGRVEITAQNHGFAVEADTLPEELEVTHINLNDQTIEGVRHRHLPAFSVQYHPEASAGPHDSSYLFQDFVELMEQNRGSATES